MQSTLSRRSMLALTAQAIAASALPAASAQTLAGAMQDRRPAPADRKFRSAAVETFMADTCQRIADPEMAAIFRNCFPNTLDTTVEPGSFEGQPDTAVITGDIPAMWLRDSSAQVWPYLPLAKKDRALQVLLGGVIRRQARCLLIDPYANAFMAKLGDPPLSWSMQDKTEMKPGVAERKYELDSLCYPIRLAHGYWQATGDTAPFDAIWKQAMALAVTTMQVQQRKSGNGPYRFQRMSELSIETLPNDGYGNPVKPAGLIASGFRPSDDACTFPFLVPANHFAVTSLRQLAAMVNAIHADAGLANRAAQLADDVESALAEYAIAVTPRGTIWAYEVDGFGSQLLMDDANVPSLLALPYIAGVKDADLYARTRSFVWSAANPWFFRGKAGEGIGGPHAGRGMIWPMSQMMYALTSSSSVEIRRALNMLKASAAGTGFMHESYSMNDARQFTRPWFAWANTLFGELIARTAAKQPELLRA